MKESLTPQQIENWKCALTGMFGPFALIMPDEMVQRVRDMTQAVLDISEKREHGDAVSAAVLAMRDYRHVLVYDRQLRCWQILTPRAVYAFSLTPQDATRLLQENRQITRIESNSLTNIYAWRATAE